MDVKWESPPTISRGRRADSSEHALAAELRDNPDQWARVKDFEGEEQVKASALAQQIRTGTRAAFRTDGPVEDGEFDAVSRKIRGTDITAVYVRYATLKND